MRSPFGSITSATVITAITAFLPTRVFWGDEHVHTGWSADAGAFGATLGEALRFARGEEVKSLLGGPAKLSRPLD